MFVVLSHLVCINLYAALGHKHKKWHSFLPLAVSAVSEDANSQNPALCWKEATPPRGKGSVGVLVPAPAPAQVSADSCTYCQAPE